jgi:hypothetical protein
MLQHNIAARGGRHAHVAHAAVLSLHMFCCGIPAVAVTLTALTGAAASSAVTVSGTFGAFHAAIHGHELWILGVSALLVSTGGAMEFLARRGRSGLPFPWLYAMSLCCFGANVAIIAVHRGL